MTDTCPYHAAGVGAAYDPFTEPDRSDPYPRYAQAQQHEPVSWVPALEAYMLTRYRDIARVAEDPALFSSANAVPEIDKINPQPVLDIIARSGPPGQNMIQADPPRHAEMSAIGRAVLKGTRINPARDGIRMIARELLADVAEAGTMELVSEYAQPLVSRVLNMMVGVDDQDWQQLGEWNDAFLLLCAPPEWVALEAKIEAAHRYNDYTAYLTELIERRRREPADDMVSELVRIYDTTPPSESTQPLADQVMFLRGLWGGGIHTTHDAIVSAAYTALTYDGRALWDKAVAEPGIIPALLKETLRRDAPHRGLARVTTADTSLHDVELPSETQLVLLYGAANRDPEVFDNPDEFRLYRDNIDQHMAFGHGIHRCPGAHLATTEACIALEELIQALPTAAVAADQQLDYYPSYYFRGLQSLILEWSPR